MRDGEKNGLVGASDGERGAVGDGVIPVVEGDEGVGAPGLDVERDDARIGDYDGAHREVVGREGRDDQAAARRGHDGASGAERIGRGAGGGRDDESVAVIGSDQLPVDAGLHGDHAGAVALDGEFVERQIGVGLLREYAFDVEQRAGFGLDATFGDLAEEESDVAVGGAGEESEVPGVDAHDGDGGSVEAVHAFEQGSVAAVADHERVDGLVADLLAVDSAGREGASGSMPEDGCELHVDGEVESELFDGAEHFAEHLGLVCNPGAGKKYDFHRRSFEKIRNFTTPEVSLCRVRSGFGTREAGISTQI